MQSDIIDLLTGHYKNYSASVIDNKGSVIVDINGSVLRTPASNQKLISTSYSLHRLGPHYRFKTTLLRSKDNIYHLIGNGDPDFNKNQLKKLSNSIINDLKLTKNENIIINLYEENKVNWWPKSWAKADRLEAYGAPITRLALSSNYSINSLSNPTKTIESYFKNQLSQIKQDQIINVKEYPPLSFRKNPTIVKEIKSAKLYYLLNLANSESHNFTAEVLLRAAINTWNNDLISTSQIRWLKRNGIEAQNYVQVDGSGLSRVNKVNTKGLSILLNRMYKHKYSKYYFSSMSIYGIRGTLSDAKYNSNLNGIFQGKTGTLDNIRSVSGILLRDDKPLFISIIGNNINNSSNSVMNILELIAGNNSCH
tara:strand:- start:146 stop:1243 length:1098 start_codon:yes stop_codon:yes gene_type:complete